jgi:hypothetical protein
LHSLLSNKGSLQLVATTSNIATNQQSIHMVVVVSADANSSSVALLSNTSSVTRLSSPFSPFSTRTVLLSSSPYRVAGSLAPTHITILEVLFAVAQVTFPHL